MNLSIPNLTTEQVAYLTQTFGGSITPPVDPNPSVDPSTRLPATIDGLPTKLYANSTIPGYRSPTFNLKGTVACVPYLAGVGRIAFYSYGSGYNVRLFARVSDFSKPIVWSGSDISGIKPGEWVLCKFQKDANVINGSTAFSTYSQ